MSGILAAQTFGATGGGGGGPSFSFVNKTHSSSSGSSTTQSVTLGSVVAGNLVVVGWKSEGSNSTVSGISDGTSSLVVDGQTNHANSDVRWGFGHILSSVASGSVTYTVTHNIANTFFWTFAMQFSKAGSVSLDVENGSQGTSTAVNSGNVTTTAAVSLALGGYSHYNAVTISSLLIGGSAADGSEAATPAVSESAMWYRILSSIMTNGAASGTLNSSSEWVSRILTFKAT